MKPRASPTRERKSPKDIRENGGGPPSPRRDRLSPDAEYSHEESRNPA